MAIFGWHARRAKTPTQSQAWAPKPPAAVVPQRRHLEEGYLLPKDEEETSRLNFQHHALHLTLGNHYLAPLPPALRTIVDVGTGTGIWAGEIARLFPESLVVGLDVDAAPFGKAAIEKCVQICGKGQTERGICGDIPDGEGERGTRVQTPSARENTLNHSSLAAIIDTQPFGSYNSLGVVPEG